MIERINRTSEAQLSKFVDHYHRDWDYYIPHLMMALNSATHETPVMLQLERELCLPTDLLLGRQGAGTAGLEKVVRLPDQ